MSAVCGEGRNLTREILRTRREQPEALAEVHPDPSLGARQPIVSKEVAAKEPAAKETKEHVAIKDAARARPTTATTANTPPYQRVSFQRMLSRFITGPSTHSRRRERCG